MNSPGLFGRVFGGSVAVILITAVGVYWSALPTIERSLESEAEKRVELEAFWAAELCEQSFDLGTGIFDRSQLDVIANQELGSRFTLIAPDGRVFFDSRGSAAAMDNHSSREEIREPGTAVTRFSRTMKKAMTYFALPVNVDGELRGYSRVSVPVEDRERRLADLRRAIQNGAALAALISLLLGWFFARRVTQPLSEIGELVSEIGANPTARRLQVRSADEVGKLAEAVNRMADDLQSQVARAELDRAERDAIFSALAAGLLAVDQDQRVLFVNQQARMLLEDASDQAMGRPVWELTRNSALIEVIERCLERQTRELGEMRITTKDGERTIELTAVPLEGEAGERRGLVLELRDVSELRRLEAVRRDFVTNVSHELKTPLTAMRGFTEAILGDPEMSAETQRSFLVKANKNTERLVAIISDLLSLSRIESEESELAFERVRVSELASEAIDDLRDLAESRQTNLLLAVPEDEPEVKVDDQAVRMAISNLISNAIRYSPENGEVEIVVSSTVEGTRLDVIDHGPGIPFHEQERVFERFYRLDRARSRKLGGTGLGLAIVRHVMASHGGRVELESRFGVGSRFSLFFPAI